MDAVIINEWVRALGSDQYKLIDENVGYLRTGDGFSPFGVLCDLYIQQADRTKEYWHYPIHHNVYGLHLGDNSRHELFVPRVVRDWAGLNDKDVRLITNVFEESLQTGIDTLVIWST